MAAAWTAASSSTVLLVIILIAASPANAGRSLQHVLPAGGVSVSVSLPPQLGGLLQSLPLVSDLLGLSGGSQPAIFAVGEQQEQLDPAPGFSLNIVVQPPTQLPGSDDVSDEELLGVRLPAALQPLLVSAEEPLSISSQHARAAEPAGDAAAADVLFEPADPWPGTVEPAGDAADADAPAEPVAAEPVDDAADADAPAAPVAVEPADAAAAAADASTQPVAAETVQQPPVLPAEQPVPATPAAPAGEQPGVAEAQPSPASPAAGGEQPVAPVVGEQLPAAPAVQPAAPSEQPAAPAAGEQQQPPAPVSQPPNATASTTPAALVPAAPAGTDGQAQLNSSSTAPSSGGAAELDLTAAPSECTIDLIRNTSWGVASAAYQIEGGWDADGKGPSIWDVFTNSSAPAYRLGRIKGNATGNVAIDHYHRYKEDYKLMADMGINMHRFSFSWSRILPEGRAGSPINLPGIAFYDRIINEMLANNITPVATMYHWDLPQALQDAYGGFQSEQLIADFDAYASILFEHFGDRVKSWITFNEPPMICDAGYQNGQFAPGVMGGRKAMFRCGHNLLLAHAAAAKTYREQYQAQQQGKIALTTNIVWAEPLTDSTADKRAANNKMERELGWLADPLFFGDYPASNKLALGSDLPSFTPEQMAALKGSVDAIGVNVYTARYVSADPNNPNGFRQSTRGKDGQPIGAKADADWHYITPNALAGVLTYIGERYSQPETWVTEFGTSVPGEAHWPANQVLNDTFRTSMYHGYLGKACAAIKQRNLNVPKVFAWTSFDNFEWVEGYEVKYGMIHIDFETGSLNRTVKDSGWWWSRNFFRHSKDPRGGEAVQADVELAAAIEPDAQ